MLTLQNMLDIAMRHMTAMADALILACFEKAHETGTKLVTTNRKTSGQGEDFESMVRSNSDTHWNHC